MLSGLDLCTQLHQAHDLQQFWWLVSARELIQVEQLQSDHDEDSWGEAASNHYWRGPDAAMAHYPHLYGLITLAWRFQQTIQRTQYLYFL